MTHSDDLNFTLENGIKEKRIEEENHRCFDTGLINTSSIHPKTVEEAHAILGHSGRDKTIATAKQLGWNLKNLSQRQWKCVDCQIAKAQRINMNKEDKHKSTIPGERLMIDISSVKTKKKKKQIGKFWLLIVDQYTNMK